MIEYQTFISEIVIPAIGLLGFAIGGAITIAVYYKNSQIKRSEWLFSLYEKFFYESRFHEIRQILDWENETELSRLRERLKTKTDIELEEKFVDFLNFFEFIASLWLLKQLKLKEIKMMFEYYLTLLSSQQFVTDYAEKWGYEGLSSLLQKFRPTN